MKRIAIAAAFAALSFVGWGATLTAVSTNVTSTTLSIDASGVLASTSATVTFEYGFAEDSLSLSATAEVSFDANGVGTYELLRLTPETTYFVCAKFTPAGGDQITTDVISAKTLPLDERLLPAGYQQVEYIQSTASSKHYIDTGVAGKSGLETRAKMEWVTVPNDGAFLDARIKDGNRIYMVHYYKGWTYGYGNYYNAGSASAGRLYDVYTKLYPGDQRIVVDGTVVKSGADGKSYDVSLNLYLFAMNLGGSPSAHSSARCYSLQIWEQGVLTRDYVPCYSAADGEYGLYDFCGTEKRFYKSATGTGLGGPELVATDRALNVASTDDESATLAISANETASTLYRVDGQTYGGKDVAAWGAVTTIGTIDASGEITESAASFSAGWGKSVYLSRFFLVTGTTTNWSETVIAPDKSMPAFTVSSVDGTGGDTIKITGEITSIPGNDCVISAYRGDSADALTTVYSNLLTTNDTGTFEVALFSPDKADGKYVVPGSSYYVALEIVSNGKTLRSLVTPVNTKEGNKIDSSSLSSSVIRRELTFTSALSEVGAGGKATVTLFTGESNDPATFVQAENPIEVTDKSKFSISHEFDTFEKTYYGCFQVVNEAEGGTVAWTNWTAVTYKTTQDTTTYTWTGEGTNENWSNPDNWSNNQGGDCLGYPQSVNATVYFKKDARVNLDLPLKADGGINLGTLYVNQGSIDVTFYSSNPDVYGLVLNSFWTLAGNSRLTLDHAYVNRAASWTWASGTTLVLTNGAHFAMSGSTVAGTVIISADSLFEASSTTINGGGQIVVGDATYRNGGNLTFAGTATLRFEGTHPKWLQTTAGSGVYASAATADAHIEFVVPEGGFESAPFDTTFALMSVKMGNKNASTAGSHTIAIDISDDSPAAKIFGEVTTPLVAWPGTVGINTTVVAGGNLPNEVEGSAFVWTPAAQPEAIGVKLVGCAEDCFGSAFVIEGAPVAAPGVTPDYGARYDLADGESVPCSAPARAAASDGAYDAVCTGYVLYKNTTGLATDWTEVTRGPETSYAYTHTAGTAGKLVWQWTKKGHDVPHERTVLLSDGYQMIEYIECDGKEFIDTGVYPDSTIRVKMAFSSTETANYKYIFGVRKSGWNAGVYLSKAAPYNLTCSLGTGENNVVLTTGIGSDAPAEIDFGIGGISVDGRLVKSASELADYDGPGVSTQSMLLFANRTTANNPAVDTANTFRGKCYGCQIWSGGVLVRDYVPCCEVGGEGRVGLYDLVAGEFVLSRFGTFTAGADVTPPAAHRLVVRGLPDEAVTVRPAFGTYEGVTEGASFFCTAESSAQIGDATYTISGYVVTTNATDGSGTKVVVASGAESEFAYVQPAADAELTWTWQVAAPLGVGTVVASDTNVSAVTLSTVVTGLGDGTSGAVRFVYGTHQNALNMQTAPIEVTNAGEVRMRLQRLQPNTTYYVKAVVTNNLAASAESVEVASFTTHTAQEIERLLSVSTTGKQALYSDFRIGPWTRLEIDFKYLGAVSGSSFGRLFDATHLPSGCLCAYVYSTGSSWNYNSDETKSDNTQITGVSCNDTRYKFAFDNASGRMTFVEADTGTMTKDGAIVGAYANGYTTCNCIAFGGSIYDSVAAEPLPTWKQFSRLLKVAYYGIRVYEKGELVRDYIPARITATGETGLYDLVNGRMMAVIGPDPIAVDDAYGRAFKSVESVGMSATLSFDKSLQSSELYRVCDIEDRGIFSAADWMRCDHIGEIPMDDTEATVGHPEDWGEAVAVERFFFVTGGVTNFSPAVCWKSLSNPLDIGTPAVSASTFGMATVQVSTEGLGTTASEATFKVVFSDDTNDLNRVTASQTLTLPQQMSFTANGLAAGKTYYFKAVGDNDQNEHIESDVVEFTMPDIPEPGVYTSASYAQPAHLVAYWDALDNMGANKRDDTSLVWKDLSGNGYDWSLANGRYEWTDRGLRLKGVGVVGTLTQENTIFEGKVSTVEFVYASKQAKKSVLLSMGLGKTGYLYADELNHVGFFGSSYTDGVGTTVNVNETNCYSVVYTRGLGETRPTGVDNFWVNGSVWTDELMSVYYDAGMTTPTLGGRVHSDVAPANGEIFAIRVYDVALTDEEREQNRATDEMRFIRGVEPVALRQRNGRVEMTLPVSDKERTVVLRSAETYCGTNGWTTASDPVTVDPGQTDVSFALPQGWGETAFFARAEITEGDLTLWSQTLVWKDPNVPAVTLGELDGLGGDTIIVKGSVDSLGGNSCTLKVYTGTSEDEIIDEWTGFGAVTVEDDFELTLSAGDPSAADCLKPGETYFVKVVATGSSGKTATSIVKSVTTASTAAFLSQSSTIKSLRWMRVTAAMSDLGMTGKTEVQLWVGEDADHLACVTNIQYVTEVAKNFILEYELPEFEKEYVWQLKAVNVSAGGTTNVTASYDMSTQTATDSATYTWTGNGGADNRWTNPDNWTDDKGGDSLGYPQSANAWASFKTDARVNVDLPKTATVKLRFNYADKPTDVTFTSVNTNDYGLTLGSIYVPEKAGSRLTLDHVAMSRDTSFKWYAGTTLVLTNGANYRQWGITLNDGFTLVIDNSTLTTAGAVTLNSDGGSDTRVLFKGAAPKWVEASSFKNAGGSVALDFLVPVDGWESAPIDAPNSGSVMLTGGSSCTFNVCADSPAARVDETVTTPLVNWSTGIDKDLAAEGTLPNELGQDAFVWDDPNSPKVLSAKIVGSTHKDRLTVAGEPEQVLGDRIAPTYGHIDGNNEMTPVVLTAPNGAIDFAPNRRATCAGWKLYDMDPATQEPILPAVQSGTGRSYTWTNANKWQRFAWQWAIENKVTVADASGVTVQGDEHWAPQDGSVAIPVTCDPHVCISAVEGGAFVDGAIVVEGVTGPVTVTLTTGNAWYVAADGNDDDNDGETPTTAFATVAKALGQAAPGDEVRVGAGVFAPGAQIKLPQGVTLVGAGVGKTVFNGEGVNAVGFSVVAGVTVKGISVVGYPKGGVTMAGGLVEGCALVSNGLYGATLTGGTLRNSLVYGTVATTKSQAGVAISGGEVINCTLADNTNTTDIAYSDLLQSGGTVKNTIARFATVTKGTEDHNCFNEPVAFRGNSKKRKYWLTAKATNCIDRGDDSVWDGIVCPRDLAGRDRTFLKGKKNAAVDIGCYEYTPLGTMVIVR